MLHRWLGIFVFSGWHRPAFTRLHAPPGCIMHVCGSRREFKPTISDLSSTVCFSLPLIPIFSPLSFQPIAIFPALIFVRRYSVRAITKRLCHSWPSTRNSLHAKPRRNRQRDKEHVRGLNEKKFHVEQHLCDKKKWHVKEKGRRFTRQEHRSGTE